MSFDAQFPSAKAGTIIPSGFRKAHAAKRCCTCDKQTTWFHPAALLYFCSEGCHKAFVSEPAVSPSTRQNRPATASSPEARPARGEVEEAPRQEEVSG
jgi:endogenous inhibitor of DNA gyrase (YacG/DUF329 family)